MKLKLKLTLLSLFVSSVAFADGNSLSTKIHDQYVSLRALGMGDAFTAVADDYSLIFYNPAGFAKKKNNELQFTLVGGGTSPNTMNFVKDIKNASNGASDDTAKATAISNVIDKYAGDTLGGRVQAAEFFWTRKNWGVALVPMDLSLDIEVDKQLGPTVDLNAIADSTLAFGFGTEASKELSWGFNVKGIHRLQVSDKLIAVEIVANPDLVSPDRAKEGVAVDGDVGFMWTPSWFSRTTTRRVPAQAAVSATVDEPKGKRVKETASDVQVPPPEVPMDQTPAAPELSLTVDNNVSGVTSVSGTASTSAVVTTSATASVSPTVKAKKVAAKKPKKEEETKTIEVEEETYPLTFSLVGRNLLGSSFKMEKWVNKQAIQAPDKLNTVMDLGSQYEIMQYGDLTLRSMLDFKNLFDPEATFQKCTHAGVEFDYSPSGWFKAQFRAGINQMYYTAGTTLLLGIFNIEAATYGEEVGTPQNKVENRVYAAKFGLNF